MHLWLLPEATFHEGSLAVTLGPLARDGVWAWRQALLVSEAATRVLLLESIGDSRPIWAVIVSLHQVLGPKP